MVPEAFDYSKNTIQMDIYSMGIVFYELATLKYPYSLAGQSYDEFKNVHLYSALNNPSKINPKLSPSLASIINKMLEKPTQNRFKNWDEIITFLDSQEQSSSTIDNLVAQAISSRNAEDIARQQRQATLERERKEKEEHVKLIYSQFDQTIIKPIVEFAERINSSYAGDKLTFSANRHINLNNTKFDWKLCIPPNNEIFINFEVIFEDDFVHTETEKRNPILTITRTIGHIPQYKNKKILAWASILNSFGYGFNVLLLDSGDLYGDWIIMNNHNNLSYATSNKERREPFAFSLEELPTEIDAVQITHLYRADFNQFDDDSFMKLIKSLSFDLKLESDFLISY